jgi:hypothetical protein
MDASREAARLVPPVSRVLFWYSSGESIRASSGGAAVVERLDVLEDGGARLGLGCPRAPVDEVLLDRRVEALQDGVIEAVAA